MTPLTTPRLVIRNWQPRDAGLFHQINSDDRVMEFFPFRRDRAQADAFLDVLRARIDEKGFGFTALELRETGECIGFCGLHADSVVPSLPAGTVEIGWRLAPQFWGKGYVTEAAERLLEHGFREMGLDERRHGAARHAPRSRRRLRPSEGAGHPSAPEAPRPLPAGARGLGGAAARLTPGVRLS